MEKTDKIIIIGAGEFAEIAYEYLTYDSPYEVVAFSVERPYLKQTALFSLPVVPFEQLQDLYAPAEHRFLVAVTFTQLNRVRTRLYQQAKEKGFVPTSYISSKAFVWRNVEIGENCFIFEQNVLQYHAKVGNNVVMWSGNHIGHRAVIKDNCFISSHVVVSGYCEVGESCFLGVNSCVADNKKIARDCIIGAGAIIMSNTKPGKVYKGNSSKPVQVDSYRVFNVEEPEHEVE
jgi:sugar O-acyltransferase (sialic acid O-acetyltransferase NeuD family)